MFSARNAEFIPQGAWRFNSVLCALMRRDFARCCGMNSAFLAGLLTILLCHQAPGASYRVVAAQQAFNTAQTKLNTAQQSWAQAQETLAMAQASVQGASNKLHQ